jgi:hypothetical protein
VFSSGGSVEPTPDDKTALRSFLCCGTSDEAYSAYLKASSATHRCGFIGYSIFVGIGELTTPILGIVPYDFDIRFDVNSRLKFDLILRSSKCTKGGWLVEFF